MKRKNRSLKDWHRSWRAFLFVGLMVLGSFLLSGLFPGSTASAHTESPAYGRAPAQAQASAQQAASTTWYFAEGSVGNSFQEYITVFNPNTTAATVTMTYLFQNTSPRVFTHTVNASSRAHELRNEIKQSKQAIVGMKEYLSSVKAKKVSGREERGEKKKSKLRGSVESGRNLPDKSVEHERGYVQPLTASYETTFPPRLRDAHGKQACTIACLSPMRDAKLQMALHLCRQGSRNISKKSKPAGCYAVVTSAKPKTFAKVAGRP